jgi:hypothetical protein
LPYWADILGVSEFLGDAGEVLFLDSLLFFTAVPAIAGIWLGMRRGRSATSTYIFSGFVVGGLSTALQWLWIAILLIMGVQIRESIMMGFGIGETGLKLEPLITVLNESLVLPAALFLTGAFLANFLWKKAVSEAIRRRLAGMEPENPRQSEQQMNLDQATIGARLSLYGTIVAALIGWSAQIIAAILK